GRATPVPPDAPPSAHSISSARRQARAKAKHRLFHSINYTPRVSHFDPASEYSDFRGFFVLFWIGLSIMVVTTALRNIKETGYPLRVEVYRILSRNVVSLALSDVAMVTSTAVALPLQRHFRRSTGLLQWRRGGVWIQSLYQIAWLVLWVEWPFLLDWTWTAQVFFELHTLTFLMKMHSYAFYNGHLSETERRLSDLDHPAAAKVSSLERAVKYPSSPSREHSPQPSRGSDLATLRQDLATELTSPLGAVTFPQNLTLYNYIDYALCPTLCYELEYPRTPRIRWLEVFYKTLAVFGCIFLMITVSSEFITPVLADSALRLRNAAPRLSDWLEFSREWNIPVYHFLRRHVYFSSKTYFSNPIAMAITFLVSSLGHELIMGCITKKLRGYGFVAMMLQLPIVAVQRSNLIRRRWVFNNAAFWFSMILGLSMMCSLYVLV
ncbi:hypothetical protein DV736_g6507, partial [Chaetothyriales sp. CBS 134916]